MVSGRFEMGSGSFGSGVWANIRKNSSEADMFPMRVVACEATSFFLNYLGGAKRVTNHISIGHGGRSYKA